MSGVARTYPCANPRCDSWGCALHDEKRTTMPKQYRKKPVVIDAVQWLGMPENATPIIDWILTNDGTARYVNYDDDNRESIHIDTLEGVMRAQVADWIIRGVKGEFYPCKPDIFVATYEPADMPVDWSGAT